MLRRTRSNAEAWERYGDIEASRIEFAIQCFPKGTDDRFDYEAAEEFTTSFKKWEVGIKEESLADVYIKLEEAENKVRADRKRRRSIKQEEITEKKRKAISLAGSNHARAIKQEAMEQDSALYQIPAYVGGMPRQDGGEQTQPQSTDIEGVNSETQAGSLAIPESDDNGSTEQRACQIESSGDDAVASTPTIPDVVHEDCVRAYNRRGERATGQTLYFSHGDNTDNSPEAETISTGLAETILEDMLVGFIDEHSQDLSVSGLAVFDHKPLDDLVLECFAHDPKTTNEDSSPPDNHATPDPEEPVVDARDGEDVGLEEPQTQPPHAILDPASASPGPLTGPGQEPVPLKLDSPRSRTPPSDLDTAPAAACSTYSEAVGTCSLRLETTQLERNCTEECVSSAISEEDTGHDSGIGSEGITPIKCIAPALPAPHALKKPPNDMRKLAPLNERGHPSNITKGRKAKCILRHREDYCPSSSIQQSPGGQKDLLPRHATPVPRQRRPQPSKEAVLEGIKARLKQDVPASLRSRMSMRRRELEMKYQDAIGEQPLPRGCPRLRPNTAPKALGWPEVVFKQDSVTSPRPAPGPILKHMSKASSQLKEPNPCTRIAHQGKQKLPSERTRRKKGRQNAREVAQPHTRDDVRTTAISDSPKKKRKYPSGRATRIDIKDRSLSSSGKAHAQSGHGQKQKRRKRSKSRRKKV